jgi:hypothetical protein
MMIGQDVWLQDHRILLEFIQPEAKEPTRGSGINTQTFSGNIRWATSLPRLNEFVEYPVPNACKSVSRLAINKVTRELIVLRVDSDTVLCYSQITKEIEELIDNPVTIDVALSRLIHCPRISLANFPRCVLFGFSVQVTR